MPSQSGAVMWAMPKVVRWMVTLREPALGALAQAPISALNATHVAVKGKRTKAFFKSDFIGSERLASLFVDSDSVCCSDDSASH